MDLNESGEKIFLSYHSSKVELTRHLSKILEKHGISTWYAEKDIRAGQNWDEAIHQAIQFCQAVVLLFCSKADASIQVKRELSLADKYKKPVFWVRVERVEPNNLSYFLTSTQWFDWLDLRDATIEKLIGDIRANATSKLFQVNESKDVTNNPQIDSSWAKGILAFPTERDAAECAARVYFKVAQKCPDSSVILPTGRSATMIFRAMIRLAKNFDGCPFGEAHLISDTETFGVWKEHETSRTRHINEMLIEPLKEMGKAPGKDQLNLLSGIYTDSDPIKSAQKTIRLFPPSVHGVSLSPVGEILAYEVGTYSEVDEIIDDGPRIVEVGEHSKKYIDPNQPSKSILTIGMGTAMSSSILLILAFDLQKAGIIHRLLTGTITAGIPATILRKHPNAYIITTEGVVSEANIKDVVMHKKEVEEVAEWIASN